MLKVQQLVSEIFPNNDTGKTQDLVQKQSKEKADKFFSKVRKKIKSSALAEALVEESKNWVEPVPETEAIKDETDLDIESKYAPVLLYCEVPETVSLKKRAFIEEQCEKYHIERKKTCEIL